MGNVDNVNAILGEAAAEDGGSGGESASVAKLLRHKHDGLVPLAAAAYWGHGDVISTLVQGWGADVNGTSNKGSDTALHVAVRKGKPQLVAILLSLGADPHIENSAGHNAAEEVKKTGERDRAAVTNQEISDLLAGAINPAEFLELYNVFRAAGHGGMEKVRAAFSGDDALDINAHVCGTTALRNAIYARDPDMVALLLELGAGPNVAGDLINTPLHGAATVAHPGIITMLLEAGADPLARDNGVLGREGKTPLERLQQHLRHGVTFPLHGVSDDEAQEAVALLEAAQTQAGAS